MSPRLSPRHTAATLTALAASLTLLALTPGAAAAHGAVFNPVSRIAACYAEGPEHPVSQVCKDLVADSGTQPLYDWNEVNIANANGQSRQLIPDGKLCSANRDKYRALDWARTDWPSTSVAAGAFDFKFRATAAHSGTMTVYITKAGFDPTKPLKWSDLDTTPVAVYQTPRTATDGYYTFTGTLPARTGRHIIYKVWQRNDSPEAFYSCSDVVYGGAAKAAAAPTEQKIAAGAGHSTVSHHGHGGDPATPAPATATPANSGSGDGHSSAPQAVAAASTAGVAAGGFLLLRRRRD
ncbi:lytic polysaccharide monooxygenase [Streptomyces sp. ASQP_92]|uniref:lytic polysaccharide monooxygenase auxiliary activity family 9 protein n=1 Tax=Streptomyces sp. ASQP_92 TaxID=2979116 RepID=UPI0021C10C5A|nr:lytic polysaccharide monooxygenase [Streptomyces sp. ASQP_92]MCT9092747.1 lytic polysaccharide monooxygenase [Streptomyces sp. ASQP_92]